MYKTVFISHSKDDPNLGFFQRVFAALPIESIWMELEDIKPPPYISIIENVNRSDALFVLISEHLLDKQHTNNWVSFEVGLAANREKVSETGLTASSSHGLDVYVFESIDQHTPFAVPYFTHFMRYPKENKFETWLKNQLKNANLSYAGFSIQCSWDKCKKEFNYLSRFFTNFYFCPACSGEVIFKTKYENMSASGLDELA
ncbi:hypothetical protein ACFLUZ_02060 [Chloroflexota bacterium]